MGMKHEKSFLWAVLVLMLLSACVAARLLLRLHMEQEMERNEFHVSEETMATDNLMALSESREDRTHTPPPLYVPSRDFEREDRRVIVVGLSRSLDEVRPRVWALFREYCDAFKVSIHIQTMFVYEERNSSIFRKELPNCHDVIFTNDKAATVGVDGNYEWSWQPLHSWQPFKKLGHRVARITKARDGQLGDIRKYAALQPANDAIEAVVVVDMDMQVLPNASAIRSSIDAVGRTGDWDVICANGQDAEGRYYDTFATILNLITFVTLPVHPYFRPVVHDANGFTYFYAWLMGRFQNFIDTDPREFIPVRSCFGGMAVYRASKLIEPSCHYAYSSAALSKIAIKAYDGDGEVVCEHVRLHYCMEQHSKKQGQPFHVGIGRRLVTRWLGEDE